MNWEARGYERAAGRQARAGASMRERANMLEREDREKDKRGILSGQRNCQVGEDQEKSEREGGGAEY